MSFFRCSASLLLCLTFFNTRAQESVTQETNAPSVNWYQINTPNFRLLYPRGFETQAQRVANTLESIREPEAKSMGALPKKISIILQNQSAISNGFVTLAPRRSEFYTMPSQNYNFVGTNDWLNLLAAHEYRHVVQFQRSITGFNKFIYYLFGQQAAAGLAFAAAPEWFWEGDAVATETAFTPSGRGRIPNFDLVFRTNIMEGRTFNYHKQYLRSYKHNIPNHYVLGYNMVSYLRKKTGDPLIWEKIVGRSWNVPFIPFAFSNAMKKETGLYVKDLYKEMAAERKKDYEVALRDLEITPFETITKRKSSAYTDYFYPQQLENDKILVTKSGIGDIEQLVMISPDGTEEKRYVQGVINDAGMLSAANLRVVWNEYRFDPRWLVRTYSVIKGYDFGSKETKIISRHSRYSAAALSPNGYQVATIETSIDYKIQLVILDYFSGKVLVQFPNPTNDLLAMPRWTPDGKGILALRTNASGKTITKFDVAQNSSTDLIPISQENIGYPVAYQNFILFNSPASGIDNIYAINAQTQERFQVTSSKYGAYNPTVSNDGKMIYYNDQSRDGMNVVRIPMDPSHWKKMKVVPSPPAPFFQHLVDQEGKPALMQSVSQTKFETRRYRRISGMINPHSWGPYFVNSLTQVDLGITSQDILSTTALDGGYVYDITERTGAWRARVSYQGVYPILDFQATQSNRSVNEGTIQYRKVVAPDTTLVTDNLKFTWSERTLEAGLRVPLVTTSSKYIGNVSFANNVGVTAISGFKNSIDGGGRLLPTKFPQYFYRALADNGTLLFNHFSFSTYRLLKRSRRDINSKWGQAAYIDYSNTPYGGDFSGSQFSFYGLSYFPGLGRHHSFWGYWAYQKSEIASVNLSRGTGLDNYTFRNQIPLPRGQSVSRFMDFYSMSANYTLPLWYPDIALGPLVNFQRLRANLFIDYGYGKSAFTTRTFTQSYTSIGGEIKLDLNILRFLPQFNIGFRYSYGISPAATRFEVLIGNINF